MFVRSLKKCSPNVFCEHCSAKFEAVTCKYLNSHISCSFQLSFLLLFKKPHKLRVPVYSRKVHQWMVLYQSLLVDCRFQANQNLHLPASRQVLANTGQSTQARYSPKAQLRLRRQVSQQFQHQQVKLVPPLRVPWRVQLRQWVRTSLHRRVSPYSSRHWSIHGLAFQSIVCHCSAPKLSYGTKSMKPTMDHALAPFWEVLGLRKEFSFPSSRWLSIGPHSMSKHCQAKHENASCAEL